MKPNNSVGIVSYGVDIPKFRISIDEIAKAWEKNAQDIKSGLGIYEKSVASNDEDTITLAANSTRDAIGLANISNNDIGAIFTGSESHPYAVKSTSSIVGEILGISPYYTAADLEFACKAGTTAIQNIVGLVSSEMIKYGIAIGADTAQSKPGDALEYAAGSAAASFVIGRENSIADIVHTISYTTDTPDFWRREHQKYPLHAGRFTGEPAYFKHIYHAINKLLEEIEVEIDFFDHIVLHMPNGKFPLAMAKILKATIEQLTNGLVVQHIGNSYSACSMVGLAKVLDIAKPNANILLCSYGSGSGSDAFYIRTTKLLSDFQKQIKENVNQKIADKHMISYSKYLKLRDMISK
jgi:hydroxymethylglutaryl-CoA synthase